MWTQPLKAPKNSSQATEKGAEKRDVGTTGGGNAALALQFWGEKVKWILVPHLRVWEWLQRALWLKEGTLDEQTGLMVMRLYCILKAKSVDTSCLQNFFNQGLCWQVRTWTPMGLAWLFEQRANSARDERAAMQKSNKAGQLRTASAFPSATHPQRALTARGQSRRIWKHWKYLRSTEGRGSRPISDLRYLSPQDLGTQILPP